MKTLVRVFFYITVVCAISHLALKGEHIIDLLWRLPPSEYAAKYYLSPEECAVSRMYSEYRYACSGDAKEIARDLVNLHSEYWKEKDCKDDWRLFDIRHASRVFPRRHENMSQIIVHTTMRDYTLVLVDSEKLIYTSKDESAAIAAPRLDYPETFGATTCFLLKMEADSADLDECGDPIGLLTYDCRYDGFKILLTWRRQVQCCGMIPILKEKVKFYERELYGMHQEEEEQ
jgi:hypothetical protein